MCELLSEDAIESEGKQGVMCGVDNLLYLHLASMVKHLSMKMMRMEAYEGSHYNYTTRRIQSS